MRTEQNRIVVASKSTQQELTKTQQIKAFKEAEQILNRYYSIFGYQIEGMLTDWQRQELRELSVLKLKFQHALAPAQSQALVRTNSVDHYLHRFITLVDSITETIKPFFTDLETNFFSDLILPLIKERIKNPNIFEFSETELALIINQQFPIALLFSICIKEVDENIMNLTGANELKGADSLRFWQGYRETINLLTLRFTNHLGIDAFENSPFKPAINQLKQTGLLYSKANTESNCDSKFLGYLNIILSELGEKDAGIYQRMVLFQNDKANTGRMICE